MHPAVGLVVSHVKRTPNFRILSDLGDPYSHMGALLADAVLQSGINYPNVVEPRMAAILHRYPDQKTTSGFLDILTAEGAPATLSWSPGRKPETLLKLVQLMASELVETVDDLRCWLQDPQNLDKLLAVSGVGPKTVDYIKGLAGIPTIAVDVHLKRFLAEAGVNAATYENYKEAKKVLEETADCLKVDRALLDHSIWKYMSERAR